MQRQSRTISAGTFRRCSRNSEALRDTIAGQLDGKVVEQLGLCREKPEKPGIISSDNILGTEKLFKIRLGDDWVHRDVCVFEERCAVRERGENKL